MCTVYTSSYACKKNVRSSLVCAVAYVKQQKIPSEIQFEYRNMNGALLRSGWSMCKRMPLFSIHILEKWQQSVKILTEAPSALLFALHSFTVATMMTQPQNLK